MAKLTQLKRAGVTKLGCTLTDSLAGQASWIYFFTGITVIIISINIIIIMVDSTFLPTLTSINLMMLPGS